MTALSATDSLLQHLLPCRLRLKEDVRFTYQQDAGRDCYLVTGGNRQHPLVCRAPTYAFLLALDGHKTLEQCLEELPAEQRPERDQLAAVLQPLVAGGFFVGLPARARQAPWWQAIKRPVAMKFALFNPAPLLARLTGLGRLLFSPWFWMGFLLLGGYSLAQLATRWDDLVLHWDSRFFDPINLVLLPLVYVLLKAAHELGHGLAVKHFGGAVNECGLFLIAFLPLPYVDCTASYGFTRRSQRVRVGLAGMQVELLLAMLAFVAWDHLPPGLLSDVLFDLAFIGSVTTLLFNLNPLMKFDGYYILSDLLGVFNLDSRSKALLAGRLKRAVFNLSEPQPVQSPPRLAAGFMLYAALAIPYRLLIGLGIALYLSGRFFVFGVILALWYLLQQVVTPAVKGLYRLGCQAREQRRLPRYLLVVGGGLFTLYLGLFVLSFTWPETQLAITETTEAQQVRAGVNGTVAEVYVDNLEAVIEGQAIARLENLGLRLEAHKLGLKLSELQAKYQLKRQTDLYLAQALLERILVVREEKQALDQQIAQLTIVAPSDGKLVLQRHQDVPGRYLRRGEILAHIQGTAPLKLVSVVDEAQIDRIRHRLTEATVMFTALPERAYPVQLVTTVPAADTELPSRFLGSQLGGEILVDNRDSSGTTALQGFFVAQWSVEGDFEQGDFKQVVPTRGRIKLHYPSQTPVERFGAWLWQRLIEEFQW